MGERMKKYRQLSPERAKVWTEKPPKYLQPHANNGKVPVVYYLCRNQQLDHPHFMELALSSPDGLYLRDVIERFNVLRGRGMASSYSWSCKRRYKNRFVWHDVCEDDLILPAHANEYVLKGSELRDDCNSGRISTAENERMSNPKVLPEPPSSRCLDDSFPSSSADERCAKNSCDDEPRETLTEKKINKADASTRTGENAVCRDKKPQETCRKGISIDERSSKSQNNETNTLISLIRSDIRKLGRYKTLESEDSRVPLTKLKPSNILTQLFSCGSLSVKDHKFCHSKCPCPLFSTSLSLGRLDCLTNRRLMGLRLEEEEYFCGSWMESAIPKERVPAQKKSSFNAERTNKQAGDSGEDKEGSCSKCIQNSTDASLNNLSNIEPTISHLSKDPRLSAEGACSSRTITSFISSREVKK